MTIFKLQHACRENDYQQFKEFTAAVHSKRFDHIRDLLTFKQQHPISIEEVESAEEIVRRFNTGAMSYGSISAEAHETLAKAMNQLGGKATVVRVENMLTAINSKQMAVIYLVP